MKNMKKFLLLMTVVVMMIAFSACGKKEKSEGTDTTAAQTTQEETSSEAETKETTAETETQSSAEAEEPSGNAEAAELSEIVSQIYKKTPSLEGMALGDPMPVDLSSDDCAYYIGIGAEDVESAVVSEPMMSSIAHSLCLIKAKDGADVEKMKETILNGVNPRKWICVTAEKVVVTNSDNLILLAMTRTDAAEEIYTAFSELMNGNVGTKLERDGE